MIKFTFFFFLYIIACRAFLLPYTYNVYLSFKINYYPLPFKRDKIAGLISIYTRTYFISSPLPNEVSITLISLCRFSGGLVRCDQSAHCVCVGSSDSNSSPYSNPNWLLKRTNAGPARFLVNMSANW